MELNVIKEIGFSDYFLIVSDFVKFARIENKSWTWERKCSRKYSFISTWNN